MINNLKIRPFNPDRDFPDALKCFNEGFHHIMWPLIEHASPAFLMDSIKMFHKISPDSYSVEIDGEVHGILFGAAPFKILRVIRAMLFGTFIILPKLLFNVYKLNFFAYKHFFQCVIGFAPWLYLHPFKWPMSEITLFTSRNKFRHHGMGRKLMDAFIETAGNRGMKEASVCTDTALSYKFYESYGFNVIKKFNMKAYKYSLPGKSFIGLIYYYTLKD